LARPHIACVAFTDFGINAFFRQASGLHILSLLTGPAESSRGALRHPGFGLSASSPWLHPPRLPSRLTSRSSRRRVVASLKLVGSRAILVPIRRVRRGLTPALGLMGNTQVTDKNPARFKPLAIIFLVSLIAAIGIGLFGPILLAPYGPHGAAASYNPPWLLYTSWAFGLVAVVTVPFAWRWLFLRRK